MWVSPWTSTTGFLKAAARWLRTSVRYRHVGPKSMPPDVTYQGSACQMIITAAAPVDSASSKAAWSRRPVERRPGRREPIVGAGAGRVLEVAVVNHEGQREAVHVVDDPVERRRVGGGVAGVADQADLERRAPVGAGGRRGGPAR